MLPQQVGFVCAVLALVCCASGLFGSLGHKTASASKYVLPDTWRNRKLMATVNGTQTAKNCTDPAIHEFPTDLFSNKERQHGAVLLHILGVSGPHGVGDAPRLQAREACLPSMAEPQ